MGRPSKGPRIAATLRLPVELAERIKPKTDRTDWIVDAIERKLLQEETENGRETQTG